MFNNLIPWTRLLRTKAQNKRFAPESGTVF